MQFLIARQYLKLLLAVKVSSYLNLVKLTITVFVLCSMILPYVNCMVFRPNTFATLFFS